MRGMIKTDRFNFEGKVSTILEKFDEDTPGDGVYMRVR